MIDLCLVSDMSRDVAMAIKKLILVKCHERRLIPRAFFALSLEIELQYHWLNVRINCGDEVATSCKNLLNFCLVTPEITELICVPTYVP